MSMYVCYFRICLTSVESPLPREPHLWVDAAGIHRAGASDQLVEPVLAKRN